VRLPFTLRDQAAQGNFDKLAAAVEAPAYARATSAAGQSIPNNANTALTFGSEDFDVGGLHSTASNTSRLTAPSAGLWLIGATAEFTASAVGRRGLYLQANGGTIFAATLGAAVAFPAVTVVSLYRLAAGQYVEALAYQDSGGAVLLNTNAWSAQLWMVREAG
jgi:hypothetical protein